jgi:hypothetical protein
MEILGNIAEAWQGAKNKPGAKLKNLPKSFVRLRLCG